MGLFPKDVCYLTVILVNVNVGLVSRAAQIISYEMVWACRGAVVARGVVRSFVRSFCGHVVFEVEA